MKPKFNQRKAREKKRSEIKTLFKRSSFLSSIDRIPNTATVVDIQVIIVTEKRRRNE